MICKLKRDDLKRIDGLLNFHRLFGGQLLKRDGLHPCRIHSDITVEVFQGYGRFMKVLRGI